MTLLLDAEAGGKVLFDRTFKGTLFRTWDEQPDAFRREFCETAAVVACATVVEPAEEPGPSYVDPDAGPEACDLGEPEGGD